MSITIRSITVTNYRCFSDSQTARLAPITLLIGENSSGKTSLMAMIRILWDIVFTPRALDFKEEPYDLGSFDEIAHDYGADSTRLRSFEVSTDFEFSTSDQAHDTIGTYNIEVAFGPRWGLPILTRRRITRSGCWLEQRLDEKGHHHITCGTNRGTWAFTAGDLLTRFSNGSNASIPPLDMTLLFWIFRAVESTTVSLGPLASSPEIKQHDVDELREQLGPLLLMYRRPGDHYDRPFASAPVRSQPKRTHDPARATPDAEGDYLPMYLAQLYRGRPEEWSALKGRLEEFGHDAGLFEGIDLLPLGQAESAPFQIQVNMSARRESPNRNLVDVGYGVSQVLPLITELLRVDGPRMMLLQQPEVHLHPSAQASFGQLLCEVVADRSRGRQLIVETHSDFIIDRVRMAARDGIGGLEPDDISIVYFERSDHGVQIYSLSVDDNGNLRGVPPGYRRFFVDESRRFLGT